VISKKIKAENRVIIKIEIDFYLKPGPSDPHSFHPQSIKVGRPEDRKGQWLQPDNNF